MSTVQKMRSIRPVLADLTQQVRQEVLRPSHDTSLEHADRLRIGLCVAQHCGSSSLIEELSAELDQLAGAGSAETVLDGSRWESTLAPMMRALLEHAVEVTVDPASAGEPEIERLRQAGVTDTRVVAASQVIAFVSYYARLILAHRILEQSDSTTGSVPAFVDVRDDSLGNPRQVYPIMNWTGWVSGRPDPDKTIDMSNKDVGASDYYGVLRHEPRVLELRTLLYDQIMTGEATLDRAEREFVALATSLTTGCQFCASVHGRRHFFLSKDTTTTPRLKEYGLSGLENPRHRALAAFAAALAVNPPILGTEHIDALRAAGLEDQEILDAAGVSSMFAWANRLMLTLGEGSL